MGIVESMLGVGGLVGIAWAATGTLSYSLSIILLTVGIGLIALAIALVVSKLWKHERGEAKWKGTAQSLGGNVAVARTVIASDSSMSTSVGVGVGMGPGPGSSGGGGATYYSQPQSQPAQLPSHLGQHYMMMPAEHAARHGVTTTTWGGFRQPQPEPFTYRGAGMSLVGGTATSGAETNIKPISSIPTATTSVASSTSTYQGV